MKVGIIAALPREVAGLVKGWETRRLPGKVWVSTRGDAVVACAGMGAARATVAVQAAMQAMAVTELVSVGLAGGCDPAVRVGEVVRAGVVIDGRTGERYSREADGQVVVTADAIASVAEKARLYAAYRATAVDMEAAAVARLAAAHGLGFRAIKAISDAADFAMDDLGRFATQDGQFREGAFALHVAVRPRMWGQTVALARNSGRALRALTAALDAELDWYREQD